MSDFRRLLMAAWGISEGDHTFDDFDLGNILFYKQTASAGFDMVKVAVTPYIQVTAGHSITFATGLSVTMVNNALQIAIYDSSKNPANHYDQNTATRTIASFSSIAGATPYVRMVCDFDNLANAYILDNTTGQYLFNGADYV